MFDNPFYNFPIERILEALNCQKGGKDMYFSPFRNETAASLHIDRAKNLWYDHGAGIGGTNIQLIMLARHCNQKEAYKFIASIDPTLSVNTLIEDKKKSSEIISVREIRSNYLIRYLESRKIPIDLARVYCKEVIVRNNDRGQNFTLIGFENNAGGYALKSPGGLKSSSKAGITTFNSSGARSVATTTDNVSVFEGFFDFLSWLVLQSTTVPSCDTLVLNSVNNLNKAEVYIKSHSKAMCFLDNDQAGRKTLESVRRMIPDNEIKDMSRLYHDCKDLNEMLQNSRAFDLGKSLSRKV